MSKPSFLAELKRRNVLRAGALYIAAAWALSQGVAQMLPVFDFPNWVIRWFVIAAMIGFPFAMLFSWFYEWTAHGIVREGEVEVPETVRHSTSRKLDFAIIGVLSVAVVLLIADRLVLHRDAATGVAAAPDRSIAVLPFVNMSGNPKDDYFSDGITEEILNALAQVPRLQVAGRTSAFAFKGKAEDLRKVGEALGVAVVLEGSVQKSGDEVRITAQLIDVKSGFHLWSDKYDRKLTSIFAVEDEISKSIADKLQAQLAAGGLTRKPVDPLAHDFYLRGLSLLAARGPGLRDAVAAFTSAVDIAPDYAQAWGALAQAQVLYPAYQLGSTQDAFPRALESARHALVLNPDTASALVAQAIVYSSQCQWAKGDAAFARALTLAPGDAETVGQYAQFLAGTGHPEQALAESERAQKLDPLAPANSLQIGWTLYVLHRYDEAWAQYQRTTAAFPDFARGQGSAAYIATAMHRWPEAEQHARKFSALAGLTEQQTTQFIDLIHGMADPALHASTARTLQTAPGWQKFRDNTPMLYAPWLCMLDDCQAALPALEQIAAQGAGDESDGIWDPVFDPIRADPRFKAVLKKMGLPYTPKGTVSP
jgi:TolB-like protein/Tfp pilus assembly protein PilF